VEALAAKKERERAGKPQELEEVIKVKDILQIPLAAWLLFFICLFFYIGVLTFYTVASDIMQNTGNYYSPDTATMFISIPNFVSILFSPNFWSLGGYKRVCIKFYSICKWNDDPSACCLSGSCE